MPAILCGCAARLRLTLSVNLSILMTNQLNLKMDFNKIVVLGSNSFTGSNFINYVLEKNDAEVIGISRSPEYNQIFLAYLYKKEGVSKKFRFCKLDLNNDLEEIIKLLDRVKPEVIVNYAAQGEVRNSWKWPEQWFMTNCLSVVKLSNILKDKSYLKRYVCISTPEVYGSTGKNIPESFTFRPSTPYAASKLAGDLFLLTLFKKYNFPVVFTRSANVYGMHQQLYRIIPRTIISLKLMKKIELHGGGRAVRSFIHVRDVADATLRIIKNGSNGNIYHIAPQNEAFTIRHIVKIICDIMGYDFNKSVRIEKKNFGQDLKYSLDSSKIRKELGWKTKISIKEGIKETISWIEENWEEIKKQSFEYIHKN